jgi:hypothetical protein
MKIEFNIIRKILINDYSDLCMILNSSIAKDGKIHVDINQIKSTMDSLRMNIALIAATCIEGREDFQAIDSNEIPILRDAL